MLELRRIETSKQNLNHSNQSCSDSTIEPCKLGLLSFSAALWFLLFESARMKRSPVRARPNIRAHMSRAVATNSSMCVSSLSEIKYSSSMYRLTLPLRPCKPAALPSLKSLSTPPVEPPHAPKRIRACRNSSHGCFLPIEKLRCVTRSASRHASMTLSFLLMNSFSARCWWSAICDSSRVASRRKHLAKLARCVDLLATTSAW